ncbi:insulinase family protein [Pseudoflavonifractor sp. 524-17]|uniref:EF-P 5-aminopentanol modification-associated protein YfmH n=1 Tax=Pseudoflavonifractor sp. 524-17 TaxID=2304577 RepID=UPI00137B6DFE|nr:pitrilysin family protein [Pseudoflavonifractor sp. 524-17]NCE64304.1 insulinase family protein [Pseudoflavonifractor sp. 524-17]
MDKKTYSRVGEALWHTRLDNGLHIYVDVKPDFQKSYAFFATNYGGMDTRFQLGGQWQDTPAGVAHFLEHKMFDTQDGNALQDLAANGASPNAFTSSAITGYYFESTEKFEENLKILLSFVSIPWFTQESVDKEQGIIGQEIQMIEDDPMWQAFMNLLAGLYASNPIRISVAGSRESISHITADTLYACHKAFYHPANMVLCVAGNVNPQRVAELAREILPAQGGEEIVRDYGAPEPEHAAQPLRELNMEVSAPIFQLGFKADPAPMGQERLRQQLIGELVGEVLAGASSPLYADLYDRGLINKNFGVGYEAYPGCAFLAAGGESRDPEAVRDAVLAEAERLGRSGIDASLFARLKKAAYGSRVRALNSFEHICVQQAQAHFDGADYLDFPAVFDTISQQDVEGALRRWCTSERACLAVVRPKGAL